MATAMDAAMNFNPVMATSSPRTAAGVVPAASQVSLVAAASQVIQFYQRYSLISFINGTVFRCPELDCKSIIQPTPFLYSNNHEGDRP
jgi:hypothetical protein